MTRMKKVRGGQAPKKRRSSDLFGVYSCSSSRNGSRLLRDLCSSKSPKFESFSNTSSKLQSSTEDRFFGSDATNRVQVAKKRAVGRGVAKPKKAARGRGRPQE